VPAEPTAVATAAPGRRLEASEPYAPSLGGGTPAQGRVLGPQGRQTVRRLLEAGLAEFNERGFQGVTVDDVVRRAKTSHGTFYLYFSSKDDLFRTLLRDALADMEQITDEFPVVTANERGRAALRNWVSRFCDTYQSHATVIRILSQADVVGEDVYGDGLQVLFRLAEAITQGMTASTAARAATASAASQASTASAASQASTASAASQASTASAASQASTASAASQASTASASDEEVLGHAELTAVACLMMLERINYLMAVDVQLPREEMIDRLAAITYAAFNPADRS
jgi:AcrR family transcriptional regulator